MITRRQFISGCTGLAAAAFATPRISRGKNLKRLVKVIDEAMGRGAQFLEKQQAADGAWRSSVYGPLKDGPSLTAIIAPTLAKLGDEVQSRTAFLRAVEYLAKIDPTSADITYPVYAAAGAVIAIGSQGLGRCAAARDRWLANLRGQQLIESLGWQETDESYGGWSFARESLTPIEGKPRSPLAAPNLSATVFALDALRAAGCGPEDGAIKTARIFVQRCQNWCDDESTRDGRFDDGGFFFLHDDATRNKAGEAGIDTTGRVRYVSYGSTTADGLRALLACGLPTEHPRVRAARHWLITNFSAEKHPGGYPADREYLRQALYYYYCASTAEALRKASAGEEDCGCSWAFRFTEALVSRQRSDGSWINSAVDVREDDPLVATPLAISALASCKAVVGRIS